MSGQISKAVFVLVLSGLTDMLDGMIARNLNQFTELGQMLDPLSDKLTQAAVVICFAIKDPMLMPLLAIFLVKEISMVTGGIYLIRRHKKPGGSQWYGKLATVVFYISFTAIVIYRINGNDSILVPVILLSITAAFMIYAFVRYIKIFFYILRSDDPAYNIDIDEVMDKKQKNK
jgi:cardiolipin synthase